MKCTTKRRPGNVSFVRFKLGLSQQQLADTLGLSRSMIAMIETGKRKLSGPVAALYQEMCEKAEALNPNGYRFVKRGRKPAVNNFVSVTNYAGIDKTESFIAALKQKKETLSYRQKGLQIRKKAMEERYRRYSNQLSYVTAMLKVSDKLVVSLPEGKMRDKYELKQAVFYARQVKLKQQLRKCGVVEQLKLQYELNKLEKMIEVVENYFSSLLDLTVSKDSQKIARICNSQDSCVVTLE